jgi:hypothetical protein
LFVVGAFVDIGGCGPVAFAHRARRVDDKDDIEPIQAHVTIVASLDMEGQRDVADPFRRLRGELRFGRYQARTDDAAAAVLKIVSR